MELKEILLKRAMGFEIEEVQEEYGESDGVLKLQKRKVTKKFIPPDSLALKFLLNQTVDSGENSYDNLSYDELMVLKDELISEINEITD